MDPGVVEHLQGSPHTGRKMSTLGYCGLPLAHEALVALDVEVPLSSPSRYNEIR